ncbi:hypothetical protein [Streptomyces sp. SID10815]|uniref:hypothetical protein n=1 Tax=Streptomyces sp. SID10815 TaxID=2706027 RepID=UPI0013C6E543|nr:hypothetical protein [Streptomyces sp. SID10815]NEA49694.1 hypothetical protein [Streptomyces sp. SID10815]
MRHGRPGLNAAPFAADALVSSAKLSLWNFRSGGTDCKAYPWEVWDTARPSTASHLTCDTAIDPRGMATSMTDTVAGAFTARYPSAAPGQATQPVPAPLRSAGRPYRRVCGDQPLSGVS